MRRLGRWRHSRADDRRAGGLERLGIPVHAVPGNHDHLTDTDRVAYEASFPNQANYRFEQCGWQFVGLDTSEGTHFKDTHISQVTLDWLDAELPRLDRAKPTVVFTHFPLGTDVTYRPKNADDLLRRFHACNVQAIFSGHWHGYTERRAGDAVLTTDRCCSRVRGNHDGTPEKGWFVCEAAAGKITRRFVKIPAFPA